MITSQTSLEIGSISVFHTDYRNNIQALRHAFRYGRTARKAAEAAFKIKIVELEEENNRIKESRRLASESFQKQIQALQFRFDNSRRMDLELFQKKVQDLELTVNQLTEKLEKANKLIAWFRQQYFGQKSEKTQPQSINNQPDSLPDNVQPKRKRGQQPGPGNGHGRSDFSQLEIDKEEFLEIPDCACKTCGKPYLLLQDTADSEVAEINVKTYRRIYKRKKYVSQCLCKGKKLKTAPVALKLYPKTKIGNSLWVYLLVWKYLRGVPIHRVLQDLALRKLPLSAGTVTGGFRFIDKFLDFLYQPIIAHCQADDLWNADETSWQVFEDNDGTRSPKKWWFWLFAGKDAIVYKLDKSRSRKVPQSFFTDSSGIVVTDRFGSYKSLPESMKNAWCWVHVKRDFRKIFLGIPKLKDWAKEWLTEIGLLFALNHRRVKLWKSGQDWQEAQAAVEQHLQKLKERLERQLQEPNLHQQQKKVLSSLKNYWDGLLVFLAEPRIPPENNRAERLLRNIVINRKNSYGSGKEWSGMFAAKLFTVFQTWLVNGLNPEALLLDYFNECSKLSKIRGKPPPAPDTSLFLPWTMSGKRKQTFSIPNNIKKPA